MFMTLGSKRPANSTQKVLILSPAVSGKTLWNLVVDGPLDLTTAGTWTVTPFGTFNLVVEVGGGCGQAGTEGISAGNGQSGGTSSFNNVQAFGGGGGRDSGSGSGFGVGGGATGGDINLTGTQGSQPVTGGASPNSFSGSGGNSGPNGQGGSGGGYAKALSMRIRKNTVYSAVVGIGGSALGTGAAGHAGRIKFSL